MKRVGDLVTSLMSWVFPQDDEVVGSKSPGTLQTVEDARREWLAACAHFENVSDPELVDHAIYLMEAAQRKYMYVLRRAREENLSHPYRSDA